MPDLAYHKRNHNFGIRMHFLREVAEYFIIEASKHPTILMRRKRYPQLRHLNCHTASSALTTFFTETTQTKCFEHVSGYFIHSEHSWINITQRVNASHPTTIILDSAFFDLHISSIILTTKSAIYNFYARTNLGKASESNPDPIETQICLDLCRKLHKNEMKNDVSYRKAFNKIKKALRIYPENRL